MTEYDSGVIQQAADNLYKTARSIEILWAIAGIFIGAPLVASFAFFYDSGSMWVGACIGALLGAYYGFAQGRTKAMMLRLQAQTALCQMQIEQNTAKLLSSQQ